MTSFVHVLQTWSLAFIPLETTHNSPVTNIIANTKYALSKALWMNQRADWEWPLSKPKCQGYIYTCMLIRKWYHLGNQNRIRKLLTQSWTGTEFCNIRNISWSKVWLVDRWTVAMWTTRWPIPGTCISGESFVKLELSYLQMLLVFLFCFVF